VAVSCEHGNEPSGSITGGKIVSLLASQEGLFSMEINDTCNKEPSRKASVE
jgi:hypothetical protein